MTPQDDQDWSYTVHHYRNDTSVLMRSLNELRKLAAGSGFTVSVCAVTEAGAESLTEQDRERADLIANNPHLSLGDRQLVSKLVRLHDSLEERLMDSFNENRGLRARNRELEPL